MELTSAKVIKRDLRQDNFDPMKIYLAINKAKNHTSEAVDIQKVLFNVINKLTSKDKNTFNVEEIQDYVEDSLIKESYNKTHKAYVLYREERRKARNLKLKELHHELSDPMGNDTISENGNMSSYTPSGMMMKFASDSTKQLALDYLVKPEFAQAHKNGDIWLHDLDYYSTGSITCLTHPMDLLTENGFKANYNSMRPAKSIESASIMCCISLQTVQNECHR